MRKYIPILLLIASSFTACKKSDTPNPAPAAPFNVDVYVVGTTVASNGVTVATYWKNGVATKLGDSTTGTIAKGIAVKGSDVYVAGYTYSSSVGPEKAIIWKNGVAQPLTDNTVSQSMADCIAVDDNGNVYAAGFLVTGGVFQSTVYWKNGAVVELPHGTDIVVVPHAITVSNSDVYVAASIAGHSGLLSVYWKNNVLVKPVDTISYSYATGIAVQGQDVYLSGAMMVANDNDVATCWKNGVSQKLTDSVLSSRANAVYVNGTDIYVAGFSGQNDNYSGNAAYWKNGVQNVLTNAAANASGNAMTVNGTDIYIAGTNAFGAVYWKNGAPVQLATNGSAYGVVVIPH